MSKLNKQPIRDFMQKHYTDARLAELLAHAQDGKLAYFSCCCFIGVATATQALKGATLKFHDDMHYSMAKRLEGGREAEKAFAKLSLFNSTRRRLLIPMIRAEMWRRAKLRKVTMAAELNRPASRAQSIQESALEQDVAK